MNLSNVKLIFLREVRDQLRDRRTLFMIAVLPMLLYPMMGVGFFQIIQFMGTHASTVYVIGGTRLDGQDEKIALFKGTQFAVDVTDSEQSGDTLFNLVFAEDEPLDISSASGNDGEQTLLEREKKLLEAARQAVRNGQYEAVIYIPPDFVDRLHQFQQKMKNRSGRESKGGEEIATEIPSPVIYYNTANESSKVAHVRLKARLEEWRARIGRDNLKANNLPVEAVRPFNVEQQDLADEEHRDVAVWSKALPFVLMIWALTGAFYPAVDLCAGEKERGTLETLLSSPAERTEIVIGKLGTVMLFSIATAVLNLISLGLTGAFVISNLKTIAPQVNIGLPPIESAGWLVLALVPMSALFGALCLSLAAFARSTKEGQYYLMPLILVILPLMILPMTPSVQLTFGTSLIPVTGLMLLLRETLQGNLHGAALHVVPVVAVTLACCYMAIRWAVDQFNSEEVLFRESERFDLSLWLRSLFHERGATPTASMAVFCGLLLLMIGFFMRFLLPEPGSANEFFTTTVVFLIAFVATPVLMMTIVLTRSPGKTLLLRMPRAEAFPIAILLALLLHPLVIFLGQALQKLYPMNIDEEKFRVLNQAVEGHPWLALLVLAVAPALCEELAFRGFILSGLRHLGRRWRAILISSLFFGVTHMVVQQSIMAAAFGIVIGYLAVQTESIFPCMLFHAMHNGLIVIKGRITAAMIEQNELLQLLLKDDGDGAYVYHPVVVVLSGGLAMGVLFWLSRLPSQKSPEEQLIQAIEHAAPNPANVVAGDSDSQQMAEKSLH